MAPPCARLDHFEALLATRLRTPPDPFVAWALQRTTGDALPIGKVQRRSGCAPATFVRRVRTAAGVSPARQLQLLRFAAAARQGHARPDDRWVDVALAAGYADQSHFIREFGRLAGMTPGRYRRGATAFPMHVTAP